MVSARPGSGKTATAEAIVAAHQDARVAVITYSKRLQLETERRLDRYENCRVMTFHGMASLLFEEVIDTDSKLWQQRRKVLRGQLPQWGQAPFDIIVLDEFQDCTDIIFWLCSSFIRANEQRRDGQPARLVVLGDERQSIYRFRGADSRYLTLAPDVLGSISPYPFSNVSLNQSFRLSKETVRFINQAFLGGDPYITSSKAGSKPIILRCNLFRKIHDLAKKLSLLIKTYGPENAAILSPSVRTSEPLKRLTNALSQDYGIPISVSINDDAPLDDRVINGKMCVSTIHQFKGSERDLMIVLGVDSSYFPYFGRDLPDDRCPNEIFVALTRAKNQLVVVHDDTKKIMPFVSKKALYKTADIVNLGEGKLPKLPSPDLPGRPLEGGLTLPESVGVRDMVRHIQDEPLDEVVTRHLDKRQLSPPLPDDEHIRIRDVVLSDPQKGFYEFVSDLNGLVVVAALEQGALGTLRTLEAFDTDQRAMGEKPPLWSREHVSWLCHQACRYEAKLSGYLPRSLQMKNHAFDWIQPQDLVRARNRLQRELVFEAAKLQFEVRAQQTFRVEDQKTELRGRADIVVPSSALGGGGGGGSDDDDESIDSVWEIKFVSQLSNEHFVQACTYTYLLAPAAGPLPRTVLYNVRNGEKWEMMPRNGREGLRQMVESVLRLKYTTARETSSEEFLRMCTKARLDAWNESGRMASQLYG